MATINQDTRATALTKNRLKAIIDEIMDLSESAGGGALDLEDGFEKNEDGQPVEALAVALFKICNEMRKEIENLRLDTEDSFAYLREAFGLDSDFAASQGPQGPKGDTGNTGAKGDQGPQGHKGKKGDKGVKGDTGAAGAKGDKGDTGAAGADGSDGNDGAKGDKGDKGDTGATGAAGADGSDGSDGAAGAKGDKGDKGDTGAKGATGAQGAAGKDGKDGNSHLSSWTITDQGRGTLTITDGTTTWTITGGR